VVLVVVDGDGALDVDGQLQALGPGCLAFVPKGSVRTITAGAAGLSYVTVHRRRGPLTVGRRRPG
jgi:hypothetical protein